MQSRPTSIEARLFLSRGVHHAAFRTVIGEAGWAGLVLMALLTGVGLLLDFELTGLHPLFSVGLLLGSVPVSGFWIVRKALVTMDRNSNPEYVRNLALAAVAGQTGCVSVVLIFMGLFAGMFLDSRLDTHPVFTIGLVLVAVPLSLYAMVRMALSSVSAIKLPPPAQSAGRPAVAESREKESDS
jgi:F0F1-type ATP synthase assembly protein I